MVLVTKKFRYLGIMIDITLNFWVQGKYARIKARKIVGMLSKLIANIGGSTWEQA